MKPFCEEVSIPEGFPNGDSSPKDNGRELLGIT
jgi:hypothetical protein